VEFGNIYTLDNYGINQNKRDTDLAAKDLAKIDLAVKSETWYR